VESVDWFGTSMGGLIGMAFAGLKDSPIRKMIVNDVGPHVEPVALERIGSYLGQPVSFATQQEVIDHAALLAQSFGPLTPEEWREINSPLVHERDGAWRFRYDPRIAEPFTKTTPELTALGEAALWQSFAAIEGPVLVVRGEQSDLLSRETVAQMIEKGRNVSSVEIPGVGHAPAFLSADQIDILKDRGARKTHRRAASFFHSQRTGHFMAVIRHHVGKRLSETAVHNGTVYLAGQIAEDTDQDIVGQTREVLGHIDRLLGEVNSDKSLLLSVQIYISDMVHFAGMNAAWDEWVAQGNTPPRATVEAKLANPKCLVEVVVVAAQRS
jgi:enamine deaminase RidA (YjgF/YER057c/UK114 family)